MVVRLCVVHGIDNGWVNTVINYWIFPFTEVMHIHLGIQSAYQPTNSEIRQTSQLPLTNRSDSAPLSMSQRELVCPLHLTHRQKLAN